MYFGSLKMPTNVIHNSFSSDDIGNKIDTSLFVQKPFLRNNYIESNIEGDIDMKKQVKTKNLPCPRENSDAVCESCIHSGLNDSSIIRNTAQVDFNEKKLDKVRFGKVNSMPAVGENFTAKYYVDNAIFHSVRESSLLRLDPNE